MDLSEVRIASIMNSATKGQNKTSASSQGDLFSSFLKSNTVFGTSDVDGFKSASFINASDINPPPAASDNSVEKDETSFEAKDDYSDNDSASKASSDDKPVKAKAKEDNKDKSVKADKTETKSDKTDNTSNDESEKTVASKDGKASAKKTDEDTNDVTNSASKTENTDTDVTEETVVAAVVEAIAPVVAEAPKTEVTTETVVVAKGLSKAKEQDIVSPNEEKNNTGDVQKTDTKANNQQAKTADANLSNTENNEVTIDTEALQSSDKKEIVENVKSNILDNTGSDDATIVAQAKEISHSIGDNKVKISVKNDNQQQVKTNTANLSSQNIGANEIEATDVVETDTADAQQIVASTEEVKTNARIDALTDKSFSGFADKLSNQTNSNADTTSTQVANTNTIAANQTTSSQQQSGMGSQAGQDGKNISIDATTSTDKSSSGAKSTSFSETLNNVQAKNAEQKGSVDTTKKATTQNQTVATNKTNVADQIKVSISKGMQSGLDKVTVSLKPKELGEVTVKMEIASDGKLHASISAARPETLEMLQKDSANLSRALNDAGLKTDDQSLSFDFKGEQNQSGQQENRGHSSNSTLASNAANSNDDVIDASEFIMSQNIYSSGSLNIRV